MEDNIKTNLQSNEILNWTVSQYDSIRNIGNRPTAIETE